VDAFQCQVQQGSQGIVAQLAGTLGALDAESLEQKLMKVIGSEPRRVVLDLSGLSMLGSAGIGALLKLKRRVELVGGQFFLASVPKPIEEILVFAKLNRLFTVTAADASMGDNPGGANPAG